MTDSLVADTSLLINFLNGHQASKAIIENNTIWISGITEIELLSSSRLSAKEILTVKDFISELYVVDLAKQVKELASKLRVKSNLKTTDSIIAATAIYLDMPLYTFDKDFLKAKDAARIVLLDF